MAVERTAKTSGWTEAQMRKFEEDFAPPANDREILIGDADEPELLDPENAYAALGACIHGIGDDVDCVECRTDGCAGGGDCECTGTLGDVRRLRNRA